MGLGLAAYNMTKPKPEPPDERRPKRRRKKSAGGASAVAASRWEGFSHAGLGVAMLAIAWGIWASHVDGASWSPFRVTLIALTGLLGAGSIVAGVRRRLQARRFGRIADARFQDAE